MKSQGILILGGTGFAGRHLLKQLQSTETYVIARSAHTLPARAGLYCYSDSLDNLTLLDTLLPHCRTVIHVACDSKPGSSAFQPTFEASNNLLPSLRFLEVLQKHPHVHLIFLSSGGTIYGNTTSALIKEDEPIAPLSYYGAGKAALEAFIIAFCQQLHHSATILRPANLYGPGQPYRKGFGIIPTIFHHTLTKEVLYLWGNGDEVIRDYLYIEDFAKLCVQIALQPTHQSSVSIYNVGSEQGHTLNQICTLIEEITQSPLQREYQAQRSVDVKRIVLDCSKLRRDYYWSAYTDLRAGLTLTWKWFLKNELSKL